MRAAQVTEFGPNATFKIVDIDKPKVEPGEVLVKVGAAGIIFADVLERRGDYGPPDHPPPITLGIEVAGTVEKVGAGVTGFDLGARVAGTMDYLHHGGYAEYAVVPASTLRPIPTRCSFPQAMVYLVNLTVGYLHYYTFGNVQPGDTLLLHAASGGVGSMITQIAKRKGKDNTVIALASSDEKLEFCKANGADHCINYRKVDYVEAVRKLTDNRGVDVVCNSVGGDTLERDPKLIKPLTGRWLITGASNGLGTIDPYAFIYNSITVRPFSILTTLGTEEHKKSLRFLDEWLRTETLIDPTREFKLEDVAAAHAWIEEQRSYGKAVLVP